MQRVSCFPHWHISHEAYPLGHTLHKVQFRRRDLLLVPVALAVGPRYIPEFRQDRLVIVDGWLVEQSEVQPSHIRTNNAV